MSKVGPTLATPVQRGPKPLVDLVWLGAAERRARGYSALDQRRISAYYAGAARRLAAARDLRDAARIGAAGAVYREAALLTAFAVVAAAEPETEVETLGAQALFGRLQGFAASLGTSPRRTERLRAGLADAERLVTQSDVLELDRSESLVALERLDRIHAALERLLGRVEPRTPRQIRRARWLRISSLLLFGLLAGTALIVHALSPENVARDKPISARAHDPRTPPLDKLVNGQLESPYGSSSGRVKDAWFRIDLGKPHDIVRVEVHNRTDHGGRESTPFAIELSDDGRRFREVARFTERAEPKQHFVWDAGRQVARYVQLRKLDKRGLALSEIEVFGFER